MIDCFLIEPSGRVRYFAEIICSTCGARPLIRENIGPEDTTAAPATSGRYRHVAFDYEDVEWPENCPGCGAPIPYHDEDQRWVLGGQTEWIRRDTGAAEWAPHSHGPGAMWDAHWMPSAWKRGGDGRHLVVVTPDNHQWSIDSQASNCTRKGEDHDCWCRHGEPPNLTVDKVPEPGRSTCAAGAGSIQTPNWHGFLRGGKLLEVGEA